MTTAETPTPLVAYQHGRDKFLAVVLDAVSGLEGSVLQFMNEGERALRTVNMELSMVSAEKDRLERLTGEQALELDNLRNRSHSNALGNNPVSESGDARLMERLERAEQAAASLSSDLDDEKRASAVLASHAADQDTRIALLEESLRGAEAALREAGPTEPEAPVEDVEERVAAATAAVRAEAIRILDAIAADNPALAEAAELFTVAFPGTAEAPAVTDARKETVQATPVALALEPQGELSAGPEVEKPSLEGEWAAPLMEAPAPVEETSAPDAQEYMPAPGEDIILDPSFFDDPAPLVEPQDEAVQMPEEEREVPKPSLGLFGRKKEPANA